MTLKVDVGVASISKHAEEVCGDTTEVVRHQNATTVILSDGLGSGIKASILSILTTKIVAGLLQRNIDLEQVFATIADTLPTCKVRNLAYSTLSILKVKENGEAHLIEYDNPSLIMIRNREMVLLNRKKRRIAGRDVQEAYFQVKPGDLLLLISDGVINAGVGGLFKLGLGRYGLIDNILTRALDEKDSRVVASKIVGLADACYLSRPGDDSTCIALKVRKPRSIAVLTGPPCDRQMDAGVVRRFLGLEEINKRIVCGGATGNLVARETGRKIETSMVYEDTGVPPTAKIEGIDLVTEGILTLNKCIEKLKIIHSGGELEDNRDGATLLAGEFLKADKIRFLVGTAVNTAHEELMQSLQLKPRSEAVAELEKLLSAIGKEITIEKY